MVLAHPGYCSIVQDVRAALSRLALQITASQHWQLIYGYSITLAAMEKLIHLLGITLPRNSGFNV